jgi:hypothetical protein
MTSLTPPRIRNVDGKDVETGAKSSKHGGGKLSCGERPTAGAASAQKAQSCSSRRFA